MSAKPSSRIKTEDMIELGTWMGRKQAFALIAGRCSAADAECIRQLRSCKTYRSLGLNWDRFCRERLGISRSTADLIVRQLEELGPAYFALSQILRLTADEYRRIASAISGEKLLHAGEEIPIEAGNASRLSAAIDEMRRKRELETAAPASSECQPGDGEGFDTVAGRIASDMEALCRDVERARGLAFEALSRAELRTMLRRAIGRLGELERSIAA